VSLEEDIDRELREAISRDPSVLAFMTGERASLDDISESEITDMLMRSVASLRAAVLKVASEVDNLGTIQSD
jgi:hypothetical protein